MGAMALTTPSTSSSPPESSSPRSRSPAPRRAFCPRVALVVASAVARARRDCCVARLRAPPLAPRELAVAAGGLTGCAARRRGRARSCAARSTTREQIDAHLAEAQARLRALVEPEAADRAAELERTLARARADSVSMLVEEERKLADDHRREFAEREAAIGASLTEALTATQSQVEQRLAGWAQDLDRAAETTKLRIGELAQRQKQLVSEVEARIAADSERLAAESEELRAAVQRIARELEKALEEALASARAELESHAAQRRRALHELDERMRRRERELLERIEREELEATQRIHAGFEDVGAQAGRAAPARRRACGGDVLRRRRAAVRRRSSSRAERTLRGGCRASSTARSKCSRAKRRRCSPSGSRTSAMRAHSGSSGGSRRRRMHSSASATSGSARSTARIVELEADIRRRLADLGADAEAERAVIEARLQELVRRVESAGALQSN